MQAAKTSGTQYDHVFWGLAMATAIALFSLTNFAPNHAYVAADALLCVVMVGWLSAMWRGNAIAHPHPEAQADRGSIETHNS